MNQLHNRSLQVALFVTLGAVCTSGARATNYSFLQILSVPARDRAHTSVGEGEYAYRFIVRHPQHISRPWLRAAYEVSLRRGVSGDGLPTTHQGITDGKGRTIVLHSRMPIAPADWVILPILGSGQQGRSFRLVNHDQEGVDEHPYLIDAAQGPIYCGYSLPGGHTARVQTTQQINLRLFNVDGVDECHKLSTALNPVMSDTTPNKQISGLRRLLDQSWSAPMRERIQSKVMEALQAHGDESEVREWIGRWIAEPGTSQETIAAQLNSVGYGLLNQQRLPKLAEAVLAQGLAIHPSPAILDSHAWTLHILGRNNEALAEIEQAIEGFLRSCTEAHESMYRETLAHRAQILSALGHQQKALDAWVKVYRMDRQASWSSSVKHWPIVKANVEAEAARQDQTGVPLPPSCADARDQRFLSNDLKMPISVKVKLD